MKKITKSDLKGLMGVFPVYRQEAMRKVVVGTSASELEAMMAVNFSGYGIDIDDAYGNPGGGSASYGNEGSSYGSDLGYGGYGSSYGGY
jgi:hypothetical protein